MEYEPRIWPTSFGININLRGREPHRDGSAREITILSLRGNKKSFVPSKGSDTGRKIISKVLQKKNCIMVIMKDRLRTYSSC